jgi:hypothetical protein
MNLSSCASRILQLQESRSRQGRCAIGVTPRNRMTADSYHIIGTGAPGEMKLRTAISLNLSYKKSYYAVFGAFARVRSFRN